MVLLVDLEWRVRQRISAELLATESTANPCSPAPDSCCQRSDCSVVSGLATKCGKVVAGILSPVHPVSFTQGGLPTLLQALCHVPGSPQAGGHFFLLGRLKEHCSVIGLSHRCPLFPPVGMVMSCSPRSVLNCTGQGTAIHCMD